VNSLWKGLGYYSRAARLLSGAQKVVNEYDGVFPQSAKEMQADIPGIGRYSSGAISSIAYNHCEPVVSGIIFGVSVVSEMLTLSLKLDGNVTRVLCRVFALNANPKSKDTLDILWAGAGAMVKNSTQPGDINQALIELGATVCKVRNPTCESCPLRPFCAAYCETENTGEVSITASHVISTLDTNKTCRSQCTLTTTLKNSAHYVCQPLRIPKAV
jgi:A/G-specific adenine glycosylase